MIEKPLLTFPSVKHAIVKDGVVQHQVMQRWAHMEIPIMQSQRPRKYLQDILSFHCVSLFTPKTNNKSDLKRVKILSGANKSFKKLVIMF